MRRRLICGSQRSGVSALGSFVSRAVVLGDARATSSAIVAHLRWCATASTTVTGVVDTELSLDGELQHMAHMDEDPPAPGDHADPAATTTAAPQTPSKPAGTKKSDGSVVSQLNALTFSDVAHMKASTLAKWGLTYVRVLGTADTWVNARDAPTRARGRVLIKLIRVRGSVRNLLFQRLQAAIEAREISTVRAMLLISQRWPPTIFGIYKQIRRHVMFDLQQQISATLTVVGKTSGDAAIGDEKDDEKLEKHHGAAPTPMTPRQARQLLELASEPFQGNVKIIGPLATIAFQDISVFCDADRIIACMWAVHRGRTRAPDSFWRAGVERVAALHRTGSVVCQVQSDKAGRQLTPVEIYRTLRVCKREHWSGAIGTLSYLASEALRLIRDEVRLNPLMRSPIPSNVTPQALKMAVAERVLQASGMEFKQMLSLILIAGELGHRFRDGFDEICTPLIVPIVRCMSADDHGLRIVSELLKSTRTISVPLFQAVIDQLHSLCACAPGATPTRLVLVPHLLTTIDQLIREMIRLPGELIQQLQLRPLFELMMAVARAKRKLSGVEIVTFTSNMYQVHRILLKTSTFVSEIRMAVEEFAFQLDRMLANGVVTVELVSTFLEHRILLGMQTPSSALMYPNMERLVATRKVLYDQQCGLAAETNEAGAVRFFGFIQPIPTEGMFAERVSGFPYEKVPSVYFCLFQLVHHIQWYRRRPTIAMLENLEREVFRAGLFATLHALTVFERLHTERGGQHNVTIPAQVERAVGQGLSLRLASCGVADPKLVLTVPREQVHQQLAQAIGMSRSKSIDKAVVDAMFTAVVKARFNLHVHRPVAGMLRVLCSAVDPDPQLELRLKQLTTPRQSGGKAIPAATRIKTVEEA